MAHTRGKSAVIKVPALSEEEYSLCRQSSGTSKTNSRRAKNVFCDTEFFIGCLTSDVRKDGGEKKQQAGGAKVIAYLVDLLAR